MRIISVLLIALLCAQAAYAQADTVHEYTLDNGLKVILKENHDAPVVNFNVAYRVGSKYERPGITGISHLLEHMMFKSTKNHPLGQFDEMLSAVGAENNANTWLDRTIYYETIASDKLDVALKLDSDRMRNLQFIPDEHAKEMPVVRNELEQRNDNPEGLLYEELLSFAFKVHPYQIPTIGWVDDVEGIKTSDIHEYYDRWYHPDNAFIVAVGDFKTADLLAKIKKYFGSIPSGHVTHPRLPVEPPQHGERRFVMKRAGQVDYLLAAWHIPESENADSSALVLLGDILGNGRTSRLYKGLVDTGKAAEVSSDSEAFDYAEPFLFFAGATMNPGVKPSDVEPLLEQEIDRIKTVGVTDEELARAKKQARASFVFEQDSIVAQANSLIDFELYNGGWKTYFDYLPNIEKVTAADIQRVANIYLTEDNRTVGYYLAQHSEAGGPQAAPPAAAAQFHGAGPLYYRDPSGGGAAMSAVSLAGGAPDVSVGFAAQPAAAAVEAAAPGKYADVIKLPNGLTLIIRENHSNPSVSLNGLVQAGSIDDPANKPGIANLAVDMLDHGTQKWSNDQLATLEENNAVTLNFGAGRENFTFSGRSLAEDLPTLLDLLQGTLLTPTFPADQLELVRQQELAAIAAADNDTGTLAGRAARKSLYGDANPFTHDSSGTSDSVKAITRDELAQWYGVHSVPDGAIITIVGDVDSASVEREIEQRFGGWSGKLGDRSMLLAQAGNFQAPAQKDVEINVPDKSNVSLLWAGPGPSRAGKGWPVYSVTTYVLGGDFGSRLNARLRIKEGLTYGSFCFIDANLAQGPFEASAEVNPSNIVPAEKAMDEELAKYFSGGPTQDEFDHAKGFLKGNFSVRLDSNGAIARELTTDVYLGRGVDYLQDYSKLVDAVTMADVKAAIKQNIDPSKMVHVRAGTVPQK